MNCPECGTPLKILTEKILAVYDNCENLIKSRVFGGCTKCHKQYNWERDYSWGNEYIDFDLKKEWDDK